MAIRIRVYPSGMNAGTYGGLGMNRFGGAVSAQTYYNSKLASTKQVANLQLGYERALADERVERARLEERMKNPYLQTAALGAYGGLGLGALGLGAATLPLQGGLPLTTGVPMMPGMPIGLGGGQSNVTNQTSTGSGNQTVTNTNVNNVSSSIQQLPVNGGWGYPATPFGSGGLLSGLLGALI